ncbi:hypothetical protein KR018_000814 [Drosophila ironensis]|nr:hypothetical protein KR018_000814 [Drosophila ironensis]
MFSLKCIFVVTILAVVAQATIIIKPMPNPKPVQVSTKCNIWWREPAWALKNCVCVVFQNSCLLAEKSTAREKAGKTPLVPVSEKMCKKFMNEKCPKIRLPVAAKFTVPPPCGCNGKTGSFRCQTFDNACELKKFAVKTSNPFISFEPANIK